MLTKNIEQNIITLTDSGVKLRHHEALGLYNLKYEHLAQEHKFKPLNSFCRGVIVDLDFNVISRGFSRFFNLGEAALWHNRDGLGNKTTWRYTSLDNPYAEPIKWSDKTVIEEKLDGSIIQLFYYKGWQISTSSVITGTTPVGDTKTETGEALTFDMLFWTTLYKYIPEDLIEYKLDTDKVYVFELTAPENRVVVPHKESKLSLLTVRSHSATKHLGECLKDVTDAIAKDLGFDRPKTYKFDVENIKEQVNNPELVPTGEEGFVIVDYGNTDKNGDFLRAKVKSDMYVKLHYMLSATTDKALIRAMLLQETPEILQYFPELQEKFDTYERAFSVLRTTIICKYKQATFTLGLSQKEFACNISKYDAYTKGILFGMRQELGRDGCSSYANAFERTLDKQIKADRIKQLINLIENTEG